MLERDALRHAVEDARARADALAAGAGRTVDRVIRIDDSRQPRSAATGHDDECAGRRQRRPDTRRDRA